MDTSTRLLLLLPLVVCDGLFGVIGGAVVDVVVVDVAMLALADVAAAAAAAAAAANETIDRSVGYISAMLVCGDSRSCVSSGSRARRAFHWFQVRPAMLVMLRSSAAGFVVGICCLACGVVVQILMVCKTDIIFEVEVEVEVDWWW